MQVVSESQNSPAKDVDTTITPDKTGTLQRRSQFITKLPSSALLTQSIKDTLESYVSTALLRLRVEMGDELMKLIQEVSAQKKSEMSWKILVDQKTVLVMETTSRTSLSDPSVSTPTSPSTASPGNLSATPVTTASAPLAEPTRTGTQSAEYAMLHRGDSAIIKEKDNSLTMLITKMQPYLASPATFGKRQTLFFISREVKTPTQDLEHVVIDAVRIKQAENKHFQADVDRTFMDTFPENEDLGIARFELQQDTSDPLLYFFVYTFPCAETAETLMTSPQWILWRRSLLGITSVAAQRTTWDILHDSQKAPIPSESRSRLPSITGHVSMTEAERAAYAQLSDGTGVIANDSRLEPFADYLRARFSSFVETKEALAQHIVNGTPCGSLLAFARSYRNFGLHQSGSTWIYRDWLPKASKVYVKGDFNGWSPDALLLSRADDKIWGADVWEAKITVPPKHNNRFKIVVEGTDGERMDRISPWAQYACPADSNNTFNGVVWDPEKPYQMINKRPKKPQTLRIYEAHVGSCTPFERVSTYADMRTTLLPRVKRLGYNCLLMIGVQEHNYYPSMGWHVTSFFAPSSRFGTPDDLRQLVDAAHGMEISVLISLVHSHASPSVGDGLCSLDETEGRGSYFRTGMDGHHPEWDAEIFDFAEPNVLRFLLGNLTYWLEEFMIDGFRFEGVTSMLYQHHGIGYTWTDDSDVSVYFNYHVDEKATQYLMLANELVRRVCGDTITIASDQSSFPTLCAPLRIGGLGFDLRAGLEQPVSWARYATNPNYKLSELIDILQRRGNANKTVATCENYHTMIRGKRPLKIAMFAWESLLTHAVGGVAPHVTELAAGLQRLGHEVHVFVRSTTEASSHQVHYGVHYHECPFDLSPDFVKEVENMSNSFYEHMRQAEEFMSENFAICHAHDWLAAKALLRCASDGHTVVQTIHSTEYGRCGNNSFGGVSKRIADIERDACNASNRVICVSGVLAEEVTSLYNINPGKQTVIYNGIHANQFDGIEDVGAIKQSHGIAAMDPLFLFVGRMATQKGPDLLVEAIPSVLRVRPDAKFILVGDGHMLDALRKRVDSLGIGHACKMIGKLGGAPLKSLFKCCDAVIVPSRNEPFGIVVLEAWSAHKPVIATTCGGPRDFVSHDVDGFLVDPTPSSISWGCCKILENFEHCRWMGCRGRVKAAYNFSWDRIGNQTRDVYNDILARNDATYCCAPIGDSTLSSCLIGASIFNHMGIFDEDPSVSTGLALHKIIRLATCGLGGEAYSNTMSTEFGQPEFFDMPRGSNNHSYHHARTRFDLCDNRQLKFKHFELFDAVMVHWESVLQWMQDQTQYVCKCCDADKVVAFQKGGCLFIFNFHPEKSYEGYQVGHSLGCKDLTVVLDTDEERFGGWGRVTHGTQFPDLGVPHDDRQTSIKVYLPSRTGLVLASAQRLSNLSKPHVLSLDADQYLDLLPSCCL